MSEQSVESTKADSVPQASTSEASPDVANAAIRADAISTSVRGIRRQTGRGFGNLINRNGQSSNFS